MGSHPKNERGNFFLQHRYLTYGPLKLKAGVLPMKYADPCLVLFPCIPTDSSQTGENNNLNK